MSQTFTLAHLSDVHLAPLVGFTPPHWGVKRLTGYVNWHRNRKHVHLSAAVDRIVADMIQMKPDHIAVTGDLVNIGLPQEHAAALEWLRSLGAPDRVTVVPGNHDIYVRLRRDPGVCRWQEYMISNAEGAAFAQAESEADSSSLPRPREEGSFPFVRRFEGIAIIGVNSAVPTAPFLATGRVGVEQLTRLARILDRLSREHLMRIVLIHHPPLPRQAARSRGLADAADLERTLATHGAELVLHGHNHVNVLASCQWAAGHIPVIGVASASIGKPHRNEPLARYNLYRITVADRAHRIEMLGRGLDRSDGSVLELERKWIGPATTAPR